MSNRNNRIKEGPARTAFKVVNNFFFSIVLILCLYPIWYVLIQSLSSGSKSVNALVLPINFTLENYAQMLSRQEIVHAFLVSVARTVIGTILTLLCCMFLGYLFSKDEMPCRKLLYRTLIITMYVSGGLIPTFLVYKSYGLMNNFWVYILPNLVSAYYVILIKTFIEQMPPSIEESAMIDGAGTAVIFLKIILPLSLPIAATIAIYASVNQWNSWFDNNIYTVSNKNLTTLQYLMYTYLNRSEQLIEEMRKGDMNELNAAAMITPRGMRMTITMITITPVLCIYPFLQRFLVKGIMIGAVKG